MALSQRRQAAELLVAIDLHLACDDSDRSINEQAVNSDVRERSVLSWKANLVSRQLHF